MATTRLTEHLYLVRLGGWQSYLWRDADGVTLVDAGPAGSGPALEVALAEVGATTADVRHLVLTHLHDDHVAVLGGGRDVLHAAAAQMITV